ncbi:MAG TPA: putative collagen-binding domain-containing protein, partial [Polyangiaceae bacterium]|nr:putative collagen-binding domain-containing protein [Polyangiaceae bacterium]
FLGCVLLLAVGCGSDGKDSKSGNQAGAGATSGGGAQGGAAGSSGGSVSQSGGSGGVSGASAGGVAGSGAGGTSGGGGAGGSAATGLPGPLTVSDNPRYFQDQNGTALILMGSHTWNNLQDWGSNGTTEALDFTAYTNFLVEHGHNFTLLWRTELPKFCALPTTASNPPDITTSPQPWPRTGPGTANDGGLKFDLSQFDQSYFDRLRTRVSQLNDAGIWVGVYLFSGEWLNVFRCTGDGYPLTGTNNVNSIDDGGGNGSMSMTSTDAMTDVQDAMADKTVDTLNDLPNVLWIVSEEANAGTTWWQGHMIDHIRQYETGKPYQHPIGLAGLIGAPDSTIYDSDADWVAPFAKLSPSTTCGSGSPACKVDINDSDHSYFGMWNESAQTNRQYAWENFARGNQVAFMDPYEVYYPRENRNLCSSPTNAICSDPDTRWDNFRDNLGYILAYSRKLNLKAAQPSTSLCSTTYCLGQTPAVGAEMLVYAPAGGTFTVDLSASTGRTMDYEWFDPATGMVVDSGSVPGGDAAQSFTTPGSVTTDAVLYIVDHAGHA